MLDVCDDGMFVSIWDRTTKLYLSQSCPPKKCVSKICFSDKPSSKTV